jgi:HK97 family phage major capsid protein
MAAGPGRQADTVEFTVTALRAGEPERHFNTIEDYYFMQLSEARQLREQRAKLIKDAQAIGNKGRLTPEEEARANRMLDDAKALMDRITILEGPPEGEYQFRGGAIEAENRIETSREKQHRVAFRSWLKLGRSEMPAEQRQLLEREYRDMGLGGGNSLVGPGGSFLVPIGFVDSIETAMKFYGSMLNVAQILPTMTGQPLPHPTSNDTAVTGELVAEGAQVTTADVLLGTVLFGAFKFSTKLVKVSLELMQDSAFDIEKWLIDQFAVRLGRILNTKFTTGTGVNEPTGILTAALAGGNTVAAIGSSLNDGTTAGTNTIGSDDLINLEHKVDPLYRSLPDVRYLLHDTTLRSIKTVKDKHGRPLWQASVSVHEPDLLNGYPYALNNDLDPLQTQSSSPPVKKNTMLFGPMKKFVLRQVKEMAVLRLSERFIDYGQLAFIGFSRWDSNLLDAGTHPIAVLQNTF